MYIEEQIAQMQRQMNDMEKEIKRLRGRNTGEILTPEEFAEKFKLNKNTVYCWVREGKIKALPNLGTAIRIPVSQFFDMGEVDIKESKSDELKADFLKAVRQRRRLEDKL